MKHVHSMIILLTLLAAGAPVASAQVPTDAPATVVVRIAAPEGPVGPDGMNLPVRVEYCYHAFGSLAFTPTQVALKIADAPPWASVAITPATMYFEIEGPPHSSTVCAAPQKATVQIVPHENVTDAVASTLRVTAAARPNPPIGGASSEDAVLVKPGDHACHLEDAAVDENAAASGDADAGDGALTTQTADAMPLAAPVSALVIGLGVAGAGAGAGYAWRRRHG